MNAWVQDPMARAIDNPLRKPIAKQLLVDKNPKRL